MKRETVNVKNVLGPLCQSHELPSVENLISILQHCRKDGNIADAKRMHVFLCEYGLEGRAVLGNHLVRAFVESADLPHAQLVFERLVDRNEDSWTSFLHGCIDHGYAQHALDIYQQMQENLSYTTRCLLQTLLKACAKLKDAARGQEFHCEVVKLGFERDRFVGSALVDMYA
eukprot:c24766_g13_i1 orf=3-515(-)